MRSINSSSWRFWESFPFFLFLTYPSGRVSFKCWLWNEGDPPPHCPPLPPPHSVSSSLLSPLLCPRVNGGIPATFHFNFSSWGRDWGRCLVRTSRLCHCPRLWRQAAQSSLWMPTEIHPHLFSLFSSSRCILLSVISNRLKVTAAKAAVALHNRLSLSISDTQTHTFSHTHRQYVRLPLG